MTDLSGGEEKRSSFEALWRVLSDWVTGRSPSWGSCCGELEIERIARDVRMTPAELRAVAKRGPEAADLLLERMAALDLDPAEVAQVGPQTFRDLQRVCSLCESKRRCVRDLAPRCRCAAVAGLLPERPNADGARRAALGVAARVVQTHAGPDHHRAAVLRGGHSCGDLPWARQRRLFRRGDRRDAAACALSAAA